MSDNKYKLGQVFTPKHLVHEMWSIFKNDIFTPNIYNLTPLKIFEPGAGKGIFYDTFFDVFDKKDYSKYVMNEINEKDMSPYLSLVLEKHNYCQMDQIVYKDFFSISDKDLGNKKRDKGFDIAVGNLPFHVNGMKQVPCAEFNIDKHNTNKSVNTKEGQTIWTDMLRDIITKETFLKKKGFGMFIIPLIWLKPDKSGIYELLTHKCKIICLKTYTCTEANKVFGYNAQTPLCYVMFQKIDYVIERQIFKCYDPTTQQFVNFELFLNCGLCIPTKYVNMNNDVINWWKQVTNKLQLPLTINKYSLSNCLHKVCHMKKEVINNKKLESNIDISSEVDNMKINNFKSEGLYYNITGAELKKRSGSIHDYVLKGFFGTYPGAHYGVPKLIIPHKRVGICLLDKKGEFGLYGRDKYVILFPKSKGESENEILEKMEKMKRVYDFLNMEIIQKMMDSFKIRMNFIEKYMFEYMPNILDEEYGEYFYDSFMQAFSQHE